MHSHVMQRLTMDGTIHLLPRMPVGCGPFCNQTFRVFLHVALKIVVPYLSS
jgi:hypothetical protein